MAQIARVSTTTLTLNDDEVVTLCIALGTLAGQDTPNPFDGSPVPESQRNEAGRLWSLLAGED